jgi:hypothetical protein
MPLFLSISNHYRELITAETAEQAATMMKALHPKDDPIRVYIASKSDEQLFRAAGKAQGAAR